MKAIEITLLGTGFYRLSETQKQVILGMEEALVFAQRAAQTGVYLKHNEKGVTAFRDSP